MPCVHKAERDRQEAIIKANQKIIDPFVHAKDNVDVLLIMHRDKPIDPLVRELEFPETAVEVCSKLSNVEMDRLVNELIKRIKKGDEGSACEIATALRRATEFDITKVLDELLKIDMLVPAVLFRNANKKIRDKLFSRLDFSPHEVLSALAWIGDEKVINLFHKKISDEHREYTYLAGWELTKNGQRRELCASRSVPFEITQGVSSKSTTRAVIESQNQCPWCNHNLVVLFNSKRLEEFKTEQTKDSNLHIVTCEFCSAFTNALFMEEVDKIADWSDFNKINIDVPEWVESAPKMPREILCLSNKSRSPYFAVEGQFEKGISQIGGHPAWIQSPNYPRCPDCRTTMMFVGQISETDLNDFGDAIYYAFECAVCDRFTASFKQHT